MARGAPSEFKLIEVFTRRLKTTGEGVVVGVGDDAAVLLPPRDSSLVMTVDAVVEGVHFDERFTPFDVGYKALAVNLSDLAAMGARPLWALVALALPLGSFGEAARLSRGMLACARDHAPGLAVVGGNVTRAVERSLTVTVVGAVQAGRTLLRSGARAGDLVLVTGTLGEAALGLRGDAPKALARRQRRPTPRLAAGRALARFAHAATDVSDGFVQDLGNVCRASGVGAQVFQEKLPISPLAVKRFGNEAVVAALSGGEDYELCLAVPRERLGSAERAAKAVGTRLTVVGRFVRGKKVRVLDASGRASPGPPGHDHWRPPRPEL